MSQKHLFKFQTENDYRTAKRNHLIVPNISTVVENGNAYVNPKFVPKEVAEAGDIIVFHQENDKKEIKFMKPQAFNRDNDYWIADAIVVVPYSHTGDGTVRAMALNYASVSTPNQGGNGESIKWGNKCDINGLKKYGGITYFSSINGQTAEYTHGITSYRAEEVSYPTDDLEALNNAIRNPFDVDSYYDNNAISLAKILSSPYNNDGSKNEAYHSLGEFAQFVDNPLKDMDGFKNTLAILKALDQTHLDQTLFANTLDNQLTKTISEGGQDVVLELFPLVCACARYGSTLKPCTFDTNKTLEENIQTMPWYLPSAGELGYFLSRRGIIEYALEVVKGEKVAKKQTVSSTAIQFRDESTWILSEGINTLTNLSCESPYSIFPFCKF